MKKIFTLMLIFFVSLTSVALAKKPIKIARVPIIIQQNKLDRETSAALEMKMARAVNIPLNKTLKIAEYIPPKEAAEILGDIWQEMYYKNRKAKITDAVKVLADEIQADLVVCPILHRYEQHADMVGINFETHLKSYVSAELIVYDKQTGNLIDKKTSRRFNDGYNKYHTASYLAGDCFEQLLQDTDLRQIIRSKKG